MFHRRSMALMQKLNRESPWKDTEFINNWEIEIGDPLKYRFYRFGMIFAMVLLSAYAVALVIFLEKIVQNQKKFVFSPVFFEKNLFVCV